MMTYTFILEARPRQGPECMSGWRFSFYTVNNLT